MSHSSALAVGATALALCICGCVYDQSRISDKTKACEASGGIPKFVKGSGVICFSRDAIKTN